MAVKRVLYDHKTAYPDDYITVVSATGVMQRLYLRIGVDNVNDLKMRIKEADKAFSHGSYAYGDGKVESRKIKLSCHIRGRDQRDHDRQYNELISLLAQRAYSLRLARADREYHIAGLTDVKQKWVKGFKWNWSDVDITLLLTDPFTYATADTVQNIEFSEAQTDALLSYPHKVRIDGNVGTVRRDNDNSINTFSGVFLHALAGRNEFKFTGSAGRISIIYRSRWFI